ncbi:MAG: polysaccharide export protein [Acidobacteria bacterium]|nr:polysaccharide export protein [Acidobacteriota bacterium]
MMLSLWAKKAWIILPLKLLKCRKPLAKTLAVVCGSLLVLTTTMIYGAQNFSGARSKARQMNSTVVPESDTLRKSAEEYIIAADDLLDVYVVDVPELSHEYRVSPDGSITLPLLSKPIVAAGLTPNHLSSLISDKLRSAGLVSHPFVTVTVKASRVHSVAIAGAVRNPQIYPIFGKTTLLDVLSQAGGLSGAAADTAVIIRGEIARRILGLQSNEETFEVDLRKLIQTGDPALNVAIYPGDTVTVQRAGIVYVVGAVTHAGGYTLAGSWQDMTVLKAIALAGNVTSTAIRKKTVIIRKDPAKPTGREEIPINLKNILAGRAPDRRLEANDILFVPDSTAKKALRHGAEAALSVASGLLIYHPPF